MTIALDTPVPVPIHLVPRARTSAILLLCCSSCRLAGSFTEQVTRDVQDCKPPLLFRIPLEICLNEDLGSLRLDQFLGIAISITFPERTNGSVR